MNSQEQEQFQQGYDISSQQQPKNGVALQIQQMRQKFRSSSSHVSPQRQRYDNQNEQQLGSSQSKMYHENDYDNNISNINVQHQKQHRIGSANNSNIISQSNNNTNNNGMNKTDYHKFYTPKNLSQEESQEEYYKFARTTQSTNDIPLWRQSAFTWRNAAPNISFTKDKRFKSNKPDGYDETQIQYKSHLSKKSTSIGYGKKQLFANGLLKDSQNQPSVNSYHIKRAFDTNPNYVKVPITTPNNYIQQKRTVRSSSNVNEKSTATSLNNKKQQQNKMRSTGMSDFTITHDFPLVTSSEANRGSSFSRSAKNTEIHKFIEIEKPDGTVEKIIMDTNRSPGPNQYNTRQLFGAGKQKASFSSRQKVLNDTADFPTSHNYYPKDNIVKNTRWSQGVGIGYGQKYDFSKCGNRFPGPGSYNIGGGAFDKVLKKKNTYSN